MPRLSISLDITSSTRAILYGSTAAYVAGGKFPELVLDFDDSYFRTESGQKGFSEVVTHSASSNATMVDSDGLLKWRPHNLLTYSEDFSNAAWVSSNTPVLTHGQVDPDGGNTATKIEMDVADGVYQFSGSLTGDYTFALWIKGDAAGVISVSDASGGAFDINVNVTTEWTLVSTGSQTLSGFFSPYIYRASGDVATVYVAFAHLYRSDLGGMVNNPDQSTGFETYVPTTSQQVYLPRRGHHVYNGSAWVNEGVLHESEARTNLLTYSSEFDNASWTKAPGVTVTANTDVAPDGTTTADTITSGENQITQSVSCLQNTVYTDSLFFKKTTGATYTPSLYLLFSGGTLTIYAAVINTNTGVYTVVTAGGFTAPLAVSVSDAGAYWRLSVSGNSGNNTAVDLRLYPNLNPVTAGAGPGSQIIWGAQLEAGSTPSSYIPNAGATSGVIRAAETLTIPAANLPWSSSAVSIQMQGGTTFADDGSDVRFVQWLSGVSYIRTGIATNGGYTGRVFNTQYLPTGGGNSVFSNVGVGVYDAGVNTPYNVAFRNTSSGINLAWDGTSSVEASTTALPDLSAADLNLGYDYMGTIKLFRIWANDLADAGIAEASITAPLIFGVPTISGNENQGATLTATSAPVVIGTPTPTTTWQWNRGGSAISGATSSTYTLTGDDVGFTITVTQTETNAGGTDSATSAATGTIVAVPAGAIAQRDGSYILDRAGSYIEVRA